MWEKKITLFLNPLQSTYMKISPYGEIAKKKKVPPNWAIADEEQFKFRLQNREQHTQLY